MFQEKKKINLKKKTKQVHAINTLKNISDVPPCNVSTVLFRVEYTVHDEHLFNKLRKFDKKREITVSAYKINAFVSEAGK